MDNINSINCERVDALCSRIQTAIETEDEDLEDIFTALTAVFTFHLSLLCPQCRKDVARELKRRVPDMLARANREAAARTTRDGERTIHTCH
jgi:hypothetical protein